MVIFLQKLMLKLAFLGFQNLNTPRKLIQRCQNNQRGGGASQILEKHDIGIKVSIMSIK